jgi:ABC-type phosphate/phosphonate transport system substrate-binding protein
MRVRFLLGAILSAVLIAGCHLPSTIEARRVVRFALLPAYSLEVMAKRYAPLMEYLSRETGFRMEFVSSLSYGHYLGVREDSRVEFGFQNPEHATLLERIGGVGFVSTDTEQYRKALDLVAALGVPL